MQAFPFQFVPLGQAQLLAEELHVWPEGQLMQATPFHWVLPAQAQL
jgi:hypothetical protein